jgi:ABC-2 type transport system ATP-binding protein
MSEQPAISVSNLSKSFGEIKAVDGLTLEVPAGEIFGFLGPNGSGKTTTIRMLCGLLTPDSGSGHTLGWDIVTETARIKREVGYMTQRFSLYEDLSIRENLEFVARVYGLENPKAAAEREMEELGLTARAGQLARQLSGGWKQRLALGACVMTRPRLLLLDEPTAGVDPKARRDFWDQLYALAGRGITVLVSTHYMDEAERCHRLAALARGKLVTTGTLREVIDDAGLTVFRITGKKLHELAERLRQAPGVDLVAPFGLSLHVGGTDRAALEEALTPVRAGHEVEEAPPTLEDVFMTLMDREARHG